MAILEFAKISSLVSNHRVKESGKEKNGPGWTARSVSRVQANILLTAPSSQAGSVRRQLSRGTYVPCHGEASVSRSRNIPEDCGCAIFIFFSNIFFPNMFETPPYV